MMNQRMAFLCGAVVGGLAVVIGAFGAHALQDVLLATGRTNTFELAVQYQFYHGLAMLGVGAALGAHREKLLHYALLSFLLGVVFFSGSLYVLSVTGITIWGAVTPVGGVFFIVGWVLLFAGIYKRK